MTKQYNLTYLPFYKEKPINVGKDGPLPCRIDILEAIHERFWFMILKHTKVFFMRFNVSCPSNLDIPDVEKVFRSFIANFAKNRRRRYKDVHFVWVKEQKRFAPNPHWHGILLFDGNKTQNTRGHMKKLEELWARALKIKSAKGLIDYCNDRKNGDDSENIVVDLYTGRTGKRLHNGIKIIKNHPSFKYNLDYSFRWASYLAKENSKSREFNSGKAFGKSHLDQNVIDHINEMLHYG